MKTKKYLLSTALIILLICGQISAQLIDRKPVLDERNREGTAQRSEQFSTPCRGQINSPSTDLKWRPVLTNMCVSREPKGPNEEYIDSVKAVKLSLKTSGFINRFSIDVPVAPQSVTPVVGVNYWGNGNNGSSPLDNSVAISDGGIIVSVSNTILEVDNSSGTNLYYNDIATFFNDPTITNVCDPVVVYDKQADRFILFAQECAGNSANSYLLICFSLTNNPATGGWWTYKITGNPLNNNCWFDYPKMAISNNELYITGNLFNNSGVFNQALLYQINKANGYAGVSLNWQYWYNIAGSPFTLLPVGHGQGLTYGPGCYLVATASAGSNTVQLYDLTDDMTGNPSLNYYSIPTTAYSPAADSPQLGTSCLLKNGDCRTLSGFYLNGIIHFVFHSDAGGGWNGINYNRLTPATFSNQSSIFGASGTYDCSYPSIASYATGVSDKSVMIGFGKVSPSIYPEIRVINCDDQMNWSAPTLVKASSSYVSYTSTSAERWGDYTGMARRHSSSTPSVWMNGMYGTSTHIWETWIAEIHNNSSVDIAETQPSNSLMVYPNPVVETYTLNLTLSEPANLKITIVDLSGKVVQFLYEGRAAQGVNVFSFNKANLAPGTYFILVNDEKEEIRNEKIIVAD